jgi:hypothetical protein
MEPESLTFQKAIEKRCKEFMKEKIETKSSREHKEMERRKPR